jgi:putative ABC transport system permease protein
VLETREHNFDITIVGRVSPTGTPWDRAIMIPIEAVWAIHDDEHGRDTKRVPAIVVKPRSVTDAYQLRARYRGQNTVAAFPAEVLVPLYALLGNVRELIAGMALARGIGVWASARTGLTIDAVPGAAEAWLLFALLIGGSLLAALPSLTALRVSANRLLRLA